MAEQDVHLDVVAYPVAMKPGCAQPEVHHRTKWAVLQWEALGAHLK